MLKHLNLTRRIEIAATLLTLLTTSLIGGTAFVILRGQVMDTMHHSLVHSTEDVSRILENRFNALSDTLHTLASNTLTANALVDNEGRDRYLSSFLESYKTVASVPVELYLTDFRGRSLNKSAKQDVRFNSRWVAKLVETNSSGSTIVNEHGTSLLVIATPVIFANTGLPEGALVMQVPMKKILVLPSEIIHIHEWRHTAHVVLHVRYDNETVAVFHAGAPQPVHRVSDHLLFSLDPVYQPLKFDLQVILDTNRFNAPLRELVYYSSAIAIAALLAVLYISKLISHGLTRRLRTLEEEAQTITLTDSSHYLKVTGNDEVSSLARSFNRLLDNLQNAFDELQSKSDSLEEALDGAREARNAAEQANRSKSIFLANMSHELRTPLNAILGFSQLLSRDPQMGEEQRKTLSTIYRSGEHLLSLINDVLEISRIEAGRLKLVESPFDLHELLVAVTEVIRLRAEEKGLDLQLLQSDDLPEYIEADQRKLRQVLINLLSNSVKFTDHGWVRLSVSIENGKLHLEVADSGRGMSEEELQQIFQPFYQSGRSNEGEGTGLGLAITHNFVDIMGGEISVISILNKGTTFSVSIPYRDTETRPLEKPHSENRVIALLPGQPEYRILIVDDKAEGRELMSHLLESVGFKVHVAQNGDEAVSEFHHWHPHLIWMDMRMPVMDGYEATRRIKATPEGQETFIIAMTASAFEEDRQAVLEAGCDHFLRKPINTDDVFTIMANYLGVSYRYAQSDVAETAQQLDLDSAIRSIPAEQCSALAHAASLLDIAACREIIESLRQEHADVAERLATLTSEYRFDELVRLCGQEIKPNDEQP